MLWKLAYHSIHLPSSYSFKLFGQFNSIRVKLLNDVNNNQLINLTRRKYIHFCKRSARSYKDKISLTKCITILSFIGGSAGGIKACIGLKVANCAKGNKAKISDEKISDAKFDWYMFYKFLLPDKWLLIFAVGFAIYVAILNVQIPMFLGKLINVMTTFFVQTKVSGDFSHEMRRPAFLLVTLYAVQSVATFAYISLLSSVGERLAARMKTALFSSIIEQDLAFFDKERTGELIDRLTSDVQEFKSAFKLCVTQGLRSLIQIGGCVVTLYIISPLMTSCMVVVVPTVIIIGTFIGSFLRNMSRTAQLQAAKAINHGEEVISNIRTVRAFATEEKESEKFKEEVSESCRLYTRLGIGIGLFQAGTNFFLNGIVLGTLYCGGSLVASSGMTAGDLMSFLVATQTIQRSMAQLSLLFGNFLKGIQAGARVFQLINQEPDIPLHEGRIIPYHCFIPKVDFKNVTFAYPTRPEQAILKNFNLVLPAGKTVAIVGSSGNGKSTVAALLERFYDVNDGSITVGDVDIRVLKPSWLRGRVIGLINQEPILFATTVMENIRYGKPTATDDEVYEAASMANADEFIRKFPQGYQTVMGERGVTVSGGQKQRIAIARALLKDPSILILDEATSALDAESEKLVQKALDEVSKSRTVLVIAHRLSTIKNADTIVVLNNGVIVEMGTHYDLINLKGHYWNLMNQQSDDRRSSG